MSEQKNINEKYNGSLNLLIFFVGHIFMIIMAVVFLSQNYFMIKFFGFYIGLIYLIAVLLLIYEAYISAYDNQGDLFY